MRIIISSVFYGQKASLYCSILCLSTQNGYPIILTGISWPLSEHLLAVWDHLERTDWCMYQNDLDPLRSYITSFLPSSIKTLIPLVKDQNRS